MRSLLLRVWLLPWPPAVRAVAGHMVSRTWLQRLVFPQYIVGVVGVIQNERGQFLAVRHTYRRSYPWGLPAGVIERGEQPVDALRREVCEETGLNVDVTVLQQAYTSLERPLVNLVYHGRYRDGDFTPSVEVSAADFFGVDDLPPMSPEHRELLERCRREEANH